jgi:SAM-dependent methyltransferase
MIDEAARTSFDRNAESYDATRPSYAEALIDEVVARSGIPSGGRVLDVGAGSGKATVLFARRGFEIVAVEPGVNLSRVLHRNVAGFPKVAVETTTFEAWGGADGSFDLVISAQAFHWVDPTVRCVKAAAALKRTGAFALIRNETCGIEPGLRAEFDDAYARWFDAAEWTPVRDSVESSRRALVDELEHSGVFGPVQVVQFPWTARYTSAEYVALLGTHSDHAQLDREARARLFDAIVAATDRRGGAFDVPYVSMALLVFRKP